MSFHDKRWMAACLVVVALSTGGCASTESVATEQSPAQVSPIEGSDRSKVMLTEESAQRVGIKTEPIGTAAAGQATIPLTAVMYDVDGKTWTYTNPSPLTFVPEELVISRIEGETAILQSGPPVGTPVVTIGAAELFGAEYGVPGE